MQEERCRLQSTLYFESYRSLPSSRSPLRKTRSVQISRIQVTPQEYSNPRCPSSFQFWSFAASITGHHEWKAKYGNAIAPDENLSHFLLLQNSVATEVSRFKIAIRPPKVSSSSSFPDSFSPSNQFIFTTGGWNTV